jgi:hypothetical protein
MNPTARKATAALFAGLLALGAAGCGDDDDSGVDVEVDEEQVEENLEDTGEELQETGDEIEDTIDENVDVGDDAEDQGD